MSRVHEALRRAGQNNLLNNEGRRPAAEPPGSPPGHVNPVDVTTQENGIPSNGIAALGYPGADGLEYDIITSDLLKQVTEIQFQPAPESHLIDLQSMHETPSEEFRTLRTRLNHIQTLQPLHTVVITSPSPAEGKTFTAINLALAESHLTENSVLLADLDLRRPVIHNHLQVERSPGFSDFLLGEVPLSAALRKIEGRNMYFLPAGSPVKNPLELLNLRQVKMLFEQLPRVFNWTIFDSPPLLFSADSNLLATLADGTILVVKIGSTTFDNVTRAMQSLCENNVLGIVANGARAGELYSKYTYYYSKSE